MLHAVESVENAVRLLGADTLKIVLTLNFIFADNQLIFRVAT